MMICTSCGGEIEPTQPWMHECDDEAMELRQKVHQARYALYGYVAKRAREGSEGARIVLAECGLPWIEEINKP